MEVLGRTVLGGRIASNRLHWRIGGGTVQFCGSGERGTVERRRELEVGAGHLEVASARRQNERLDIGVERV